MKVFSFIKKVVFFLFLLLILYCQVVFSTRKNNRLVQINFKFRKITKKVQTQPSTISLPTFQTTSSKSLPVPSFDLGFGPVVDKFSPTSSPQTTTLLSSTKKQPDDDDGDFNPLPDKFPGSKISKNK